MQCILMIQCVRCGAPLKIPVEKVNKKFYFNFNNLWIKINPDIVCITCSKCMIKEKNPNESGFET